jgi:hypothetical protein
MKGRRAGDPEARHAHARPLRDPGTFPAMTMCQFGPWSASFRQQPVPTPGSHPPAPTRFSDTPDPRTRSSSRCTPVEPAPSSCTYMGSPGLPGPAGPAKSVSGVSSSSSWRRSPDLLGFWRDEGGLLGVVMTPAEPVLNCSGTCTTLASPDTGTSTWSLRDMRTPGRDRRDRHLLWRLSRFRARRRGNVVICAKAGTRRPWCPASPVWRRGLPERTGSGYGLDGSIRPDGRASSGIQLPSAQATGPRP